MLDDLISSLNTPQRNAVTAQNESVLILAGAGSGKTRVITSRIAWLLENQYCRSSEILAVTFTNKAAKEMLTRLEAILPFNLRTMWVGTFHGLCNRLLRQHADAAGLPKTFQILDQSDQLSLVKRVMKTANVDPERYDPKSVQNFINWAKEQGLRASALKKDDGDDGSRNLYLLYEQQCQREGVVDFAELLLRCYELLERNELIRDHYQARFRHILVDEFQDTNVLQYRWLGLLAGVGQGMGGRARNALFAVGDDDQSIYAFRGANVGNMSDFLGDYRVNEPIRLEENYRSSGYILEAANALISQNPQRLGKNLWTSGMKGRKLQVKEFENDQEEARFIVEEVMAEHRRGQDYQDFAVLYRSNAQSRVIETALNAMSIPYRVYGGQRFFDRAEIKHMLAYLRLLVNADDTSFLRVVNFPTRGIGLKTIELITELAREKQCTLWEALSDRTIPHSPKLIAFRNIIESLREKTRFSTLPEMMDKVLKGSGLETFYKNDRDGQDRLDNIGEMTSAAEGFMKTMGLDESLSAFETMPDDSMTPLEGFLAQATLEAGDKNETDLHDAVQLMTVHAAKGLEFHQVFVTGAEEGLFPHFASLNEERGIEEERRLMYVAITRAKRNLFITYARTRMIRGQFNTNPRSSFIEEIPEELMEQTHARRRWTNDNQDYRSRSSGDGFRGYDHQRGSDRWGNTSKETPSWGASTQRERKQDEKLSQVASGREFGFSAGEKIKHSAFGDGVIQKISGSGKDARAVIQFDQVGRKELLLSIAATRMTKAEK